MTSSGKGSDQSPAVIDVLSINRHVTRNFITVLYRHVIGLCQMSDDTNMENVIHHNTSKCRQNSISDSNQRPQTMPIPHAHLLERQKRSINRSITTHKHVDYHQQWRVIIKIIWLKIMTLNQYYDFDCELKSVHVKWFRFWFKNLFVQWFYWFYITKCLKSLSLFIVEFFWHFTRILQFQWTFYILIV